MSDAGLPLIFSARSLPLQIIRKMNASRWALFAETQQPYRYTPGSAGILPAVREPALSLSRGRLALGPPIAVQERKSPGDIRRASRGAVEYPGAQSQKRRAESRSYCPDGAAAVFSGTGAALSGAPVPSLVRNGKKGVTSKGIFSDAAVMDTGLVLINSS